MAVDHEPQISQNYTIISHIIHSSTQISSRVSSITTNLNLSHPSAAAPTDAAATPAPSKAPPAAHDNNNNKPVIIALQARAKVASKLISIVEIAKRDLRSHGVTCFQYNALASEVIDIPRSPPKSTKGPPAQRGEVGDDDDDDDEPPAFETMGENYRSATKKRAIPVMTTYLSTVSIKELKARYGFVQWT